MMYARSEEGIDFDPEARSRQGVDRVSGIEFDDNSSNNSSSSNDLQRPSLLPRIRERLRTLSRRIHAGAARSNVLTSEHVLGPQRGMADECLGTTLFERFGPLLPHLYVTNENFVVLEASKPGDLEGIGFVLGLRPQTGMTESIQKGLEGIVLASLPVGSTVAVTLFADPNVDGVVTRFEESRLGRCDRLHPDVREVLAVMTKERGKLLRRAAREQIRPQAPVHCRRFRGWVSVVLPAKNATDSKVLEEARAAREAMRVALEESYLADADPTADDLLTTLASILNPQKVRAGDSMKKHANPHEELRLQVMASDTEIRIEKTGILFCDAGDTTETHAVRAVGLGLSGLPPSWSLPQMAALTGDPGRSGSQIPCPFLLTTWWQVTDAVLEKTKIESELVRARQMSRTPVSTFISHYVDRAEDLSIASEGFARGLPVLPSQTELLLLTPARETAVCVEAAKTLARKSGVELRPSAALHIQSLFASLPLAAGPLLAKDARALDRFPRRTAETVTALLPVMAEYAGTGKRDHEKEETPLLALLGRRGQLFTVDPFACRAGSFSGTIVGKPGSGKSVVMNELALGVLSQGGRVWVIDVGRSYEKLCGLLGGDFLTFDGDTVWDANPLRYLTDDADQVERVTAIIEELLGDGERDALLHQWFLVTLPALDRYARSNGRRATLPDLIDALKTVRKADGSPDQRFYDAAQKLAPYAQDGPLSKWTDGTGRPFNFSSPFTVLEMEGLSGQPTLRNALLLQVMLAIEAEMRKDRRPPKLVLIDEAWDLMKSGRSATFIEKGFRQARKLNGAFFTATQSVADYWQSETAQAAWTCADTRIYLRQDAETLESLAKKGRFPEDPWLKTAVASLTTVRGLWSELIVQVGDHPPAVGRLVLDDFSRVAESSHARDVMGVRDWMKRGVPLAEAVMHVAREEWPEETS